MALGLGSRSSVTMQMCRRDAAYAGGRLERRTCGEDKQLG